MSATELDANHNHSHAQAGHAHDDHSHDHDHPAWLAHHFDDAEQQFDSGKLGIWLFLITEVLFFSGMFCAYSLYRSLHPEIWVFASQFLNETLGAINTGVLLFSSLTMAWGVRCAMLGQNRGVVACTGMTIACAAIFLGVKAVEYSHKFDLGLLPGGLYVPQVAHPEHHEGLSTWLIYFMIVPGILLVGLTAWYGQAVATANAVQKQIAGPLAVSALCFFLGVGLGQYLESGEAAEHGSGHAVAHSDGHIDASQTVATHSSGETHGAAEQLSGDHSKDGTSKEGHTKDGHSDATTAVAAANSSATSASVEAEIISPDVNKPSAAGLFFSIYYCMTGIHAIHIIAGIGVLAWILIKAAQGQFHSEYFGPVDYVGLYWHLVDFIWIYLFPLLYLIT